MLQLLLILSFLIIACKAKHNNGIEGKNLEAQAARITIIRDTWGVPHVYGKTDADAVFGFMYAQCEENFEKVERAYIEKLGRLSEIEGSSYLYNDLLSRLLYDTADAIAAYKQSPPWLKNLCTAFADGIQHYLYKHPDVKPALLKRFEPWYPFLFTDGAYVSLKTENLSAEDIQRMYKWPAATGFILNNDDEMKGSNGFAIAPSKTENGKALFYINPHVTFDFRMEGHMVSEEGLNAYGAATWGQFFIYQGFNETCGWMHTSSMADAVDLYRDSILKRGNKFYSIYDGEMKQLQIRLMRFIVAKDNDKREQELLTYFTHHGPVVGKSIDGKWLSLKTNKEPLNSLVQSWQRTKAKSFTDFKNTMQLRTNATTNTMYADKAGNIAYWHGNFIPKRNTDYDWSQPVDGSTSKTTWSGAHTLNEIVNLENPQQGFVQNCNSSPFHVSGSTSISKERYPAYMAPDEENFRSLFALTRLEAEKRFTLDKLIALGYSRHLAAFDTLLPPLFAAYEKLPASDASYQLLQEPIALLKTWDRSSSVTSVATTLAIEWAYHLLNKTAVANYNSQIKVVTAAAKSSPQILISSLAEIVTALNKNVGTWKIPWGDMNRYQRVSGGEEFDDSKQSLPVGAASAFFGSLPAYETVWLKSGKGYGTAGNSFVAAVEFGVRLKAKAVIAGGQSFNPASKHFNDQSVLYINGQLRDVFFYKEDVEKNKEKAYKPGE